MSDIKVEEYMPD